MSEIASFHDDTMNNTRAMKVKIVCREAQDKLIRDHLTTPVIGPQPLFVTGPASTGKTLSVKKALQDLVGSHISIYIDCVQYSSSRMLYRVLVKKLTRSLKRRQQTQASKVLLMSRAITNASQLVTHLNEIVEKGVCTTKVWVVLDRAERMCKEGVLPVLDRISETTGMDLGVIMISRLPWSSGIFMEGHKRGSKCMREPYVVEFPPYNDNELKSICLARGYSGRCSAYSQYFEQFLSFILPALTRMTNNILDVQAIVAKLWPHYIAPVKKGGKNIQVRQLNMAINPALKNIVSEMDIGVDKSKNVMSKDSYNDNFKSKILFAIPYMGKWILLASYIASRNKPTTDKAVFDPGYYQKGKKNSQALDRQAEKSLEVKLRGTHPFPLERMLHIFYYISEPKASETPLPENYRTGWCEQMQHVDVLMQVSSLCSLGLLTCMGVDPLTAPTFRCNVSEDLAYVIARNLNVSLNDYLKLA